MNQILNQLYKNWKTYQIPIILLILLLIFLVFYRLASNKGKSFFNLKSKDTSNIEGFYDPTQLATTTTTSTSTSTSTSTPNPTEEIEPSILNNMYFIKNFPVQDIMNVWSSKIDSGNYVSFWERTSTFGYSPIGQSVLITEHEPSVTDLKPVVNIGLQYLFKGGVEPLDYEKIWDNKHLTEQPPLSIWKIIAPPDYVAMSDIAVAGFDKPKSTNIKCIPTKILIPNGKINDEPFFKTPKVISTDNSSPENALSVWNIGSYGFFFARDSFQKPDSRVDKIMDVKEKVLTNYEYDHLDQNKILKVTLKI